MSISREDAAEILSLARRSIVDALAGRAIAPHDAADGLLATHRGAFVTLKSDGNLRGCIGLVESSMPLAGTVARMARAAAFEDPRFPPVEDGELPRIEIEVSVLTEPAVVDDVSDIVLGRDGLIVERGGARGLLLPQVPGDWGWDRDEFLSQTCRKAGLAADAWQSDSTRVLRFSADIISESD